MRIQAALFAVLTSWDVASAPQSFASLVALPPGGGYQIQTISPVGGIYEYDNGSGTVRNSGLEISTELDEHFVNAAGQVAGSAARYNSSGVDLGSDAWLFDGLSTQIISIAGADYQYASPNGIVRATTDVYLGTSGHVAGTVRRYQTDGTDAGSDSFSFNGSSAQAINLTGTGYQYSLPNGTFRQSAINAIDSNNNVVGTSTRFANNGDGLGADQWAFNGSTTQVISLTGTNYQVAQSNGTLRNSTFVQANAAGAVVGYSSRYSTAGDDLGLDAWLYDGSITKSINLTGGNYQYNTTGGIAREAFVTFLNSSSQAIGVSNRFSSAGDDLGQDSWLYDGTTTKQINLTGGNYEYNATGGAYRFSSPLAMNDSGKVVGASNRFAADGSDLGVDNWLFNGTTTIQINLSGGVYQYNAAGGIYRAGEPVVAYINGSGKVLGRSSRFASDGSDLGIDAWLYDGSTTHQINLTGSGYEFTTLGGTYRSSSAIALNAAGMAIGQSDRWASDGSSLGADAWYYNGASTQRIGLAGAGYEYAVASGTIRTSTPEDINDADMIVGLSTRYNGSGNYQGVAGFLFDPTTDTNSPLAFSIRSDGFCNTNPEILTDTGVVLGTYDVYSGMSTVGTDLFWWSEDGGFHDLGSMVPGGLTAAGWSSLAAMYDERGTFTGNSPQFILGSGDTTGQVDGSTLFLLTAQLPEPNSLLLLTAAGLVLRRRRR